MLIISFVIKNANCKIKVNKKGIYGTSNCISDERKQRSVTINDLQTSYHRRTDNDRIIFLQHTKPVEIA